MPQSEPVAILLVNAIAEEIKLATLNFRRFFPDCRVEAVYTVEEALQWGHRAPWQLIVIDEDLLTQRAAPGFSELRRLAPYATLVLQTDHNDSAAVVPPDQQDRARHRFNDRRTGTRAARRMEIDLIRKPSGDKPTHPRVRAEISARGLYDVNRRYLGTLGLLRDISQHRRQTKTIHQLEHQLRESDRLVAITRRFSTLSKNLQAPHQAIQAQSQLLLKTIRDAHLIEQIDSLATYAAEAAHLELALVQTTTEIAIRSDTINDIIETVLAAAQLPLPLRTSIG